MALTLARRGWTVSVADLDAARARAFARRFKLSTSRTGRFDLAVLAVPDRAIPSAARSLARRGHEPALAVHLGGAVPFEALAPLARLGWRTAKMHPVCSFPPDPAPMPRGIVFGIGAASLAARAEVERLTRVLGGTPVAILSGRDAEWHLASVLAGNLLFAQLSAASELMKNAAGVSKPGAVRALAPLVRASLDNALDAGLAEGLTGPVARGDAETLEAHLALLMEQHPEFSIYYASATAILLRLLPPSRRAALRRRLKRGGLLI